jgi:acetyl-CoA carboxylase carboxyl transferase subunit beta
MINKEIFKKPKNRLEGEAAQQTPQIKPEEQSLKCEDCSKEIKEARLKETLYVCPFCGYHFSLSARQRIDLTFDEGSFAELFGDFETKNILGFPEYDEKLIAAKEKTREKESVICGKARICGITVCAFVMEGQFMRGSMGSVCGEKITLLFELALKESLPVIGFCVSGGARMQEGIISLMQMAKTSAAVKRHSQAGNLYISVLTHPTTGGVTASFASEGDIILSEPGALICFAGPRVIEQTIKQKLPEGFQKAEFLMEKGFIDQIISRKELRQYLCRLLRLHGRQNIESV